MLLSRTLDPSDYQHLGAMLEAVDCYQLEGEPPHRRWEYALALQAIGEWHATGRPLRDPVYDVTDGATPFQQLLTQGTGCAVRVWDADITAILGLSTGAQLASVVTCLSTIDRVPQLDDFLYYLSCLVAPGGLLVLTMPFWDRCGPDTAHGHEARQRIFCPKTYLQLRNTAVMRYHLAPFGGVDPTYHGAQVEDHSVASLVLEKRR